jgi:type II secretory pathway component PulM
MANQNINNNEAMAKQQSPVASAFGKLSGRERTLIFALIIVGVVCALLFLLFMPGFERLNALESEVVKAENSQQEYQSVIAQGAGANEQITEAVAAYEAAREKLFPQMLSEALDSTVTGYMVQVGFEPQSLSMSTIAPEPAPAPFVATPISAPPIPEGTEEQAPPAGEEAAPPAEAPAESEITGAFLWDGSPFLTAYAADEEGSEDAALPGEEPVGVEPISGEAPAESETGGSLYSYSVNVTVGGNWLNLYQLLDLVAGIDGMEITQYSGPADTMKKETMGEESAKEESAEEENAEESDAEAGEAEAGAAEESAPEAVAEEMSSFSIAIKLYVFIEEDVPFVSPATEGASDSSAETPE